MDYAVLKMHKSELNQNSIKYDPTYLDMHLSKYGNIYVPRLYQLYFLLFKNSTFVAQILKSFKNRSNTNFLNTEPNWNLIC